MPSRLFRWIDGRECVYMILRYYSQPSGLRGIVSNVEEPMWFPVAADPKTYHRPAPHAKPHR